MPGPEPRFLNASAFSQLWFYHVEQRIVQEGPRSGWRGRKFAATLRIAAW